MMEFDISVVLFAYDRQEYLEKALESVLRQDFEKSRYEILIITNFQLNYKYSDESPRIRHFMMRGTRGEFIRVAIEMCEGNIVCFLDDDDWYAPNKLKEVARYFKEYDIGYLHDTPIIVTEDSGHTGSRLPADVLLRVAPLKKGIFYKLLSVYADGMMSCISIKREVLNDVDLNLVTGPDYYLFYSTALKGYNILASPLPLTYYTVHETSSKLPMNLSDQDIWRKNMVDETLSNYDSLLKMAVRGQCEGNHLLKRHLLWNSLAFSCNSKLISMNHDISAKEIFRILLYSNTMKQIIRSTILVTGSFMLKFLPSIFHRLFKPEFMRSVGFI